MHYKLGCISLSISTGNNTLDSTWKLFETKKENVECCISTAVGTAPIYGAEFFRSGILGSFYIKCRESVLACSKDWDAAEVVEYGNADSFELALLQLFYTHAVRRQMLQLHCATIDDDGRGILFLGPSGIGKTTQAERWAQYRGSAIINGDIGFVQRTPAGYTAWGTPWHGSSPYCLNASVPVKALVVLKQAPENRLRELTGFEKVREVSGSVFYPTWLEDGMELCTDTLNHLLSDLPVYRLDNRADEEAVRLLAAEIDRIS